MKRLVTIAAIALCTSAFAQSVTTQGTSSTIVSRDGSTVSSGTITSPDGSTVSSGSITSGDGSTVSPNTSGQAGSVILDNQSSVTSSIVTDSTGASTNSIVGSTGSMCRAAYDGERCEISCQAPQVAQCGKAEHAAAPACFCK